MNSEKELDVKEIIEVLKSGDYEHDACYAAVTFFEMNAREFLSFAKEDLKDHSDRGRTNALSNAKRAIACRLEELLWLFNLRGFSFKERWNLPTKMEVVQSLGISAPQVLKSLVTSKRNVLEHEYVRPEGRQQIENVCDVAELFLGATDKYLDDGFLVAVLVAPGKVHKDEEHGTYIIEYTILFNFDEETITFTSEESSGIKRRRDLRIRDCPENEVIELMRLTRRLEWTSKVGDWKGEYEFKLKLYTTPRDRLMTEDRAKLLQEFTNEGI